MWAQLDARYRSVIRVSTTCLTDAAPMVTALPIEARCDASTIAGQLQGGEVRACPGEYVLDYVPMSIRWLARAALSSPTAGSTGANRVRIDGAKCETLESHLSPRIVHHQKHATTNTDARRTLGAPTLSTSLGTITKGNVLQHWQKPRVKWETNKLGINNTGTEFHLAQKLRGVSRSAVDILSDVLDYYLVSYPSAIKASSVDGILAMTDITVHKFLHMLYGANTRAIRSWIRWTKRASILVCVRLVKWPAKACDGERDLQI
ncbi:hypothetical protein BU15DRAFT_62088 [Melanogaster broomeanus]|nr:hypothetical protein BU15DRAFT_62088 [Melanogaster broomeanus]